MAYDPWQAATRGSQLAQNIANAYQQAKQRKLLDPYLQPEAQAGLNLKRAQAQLAQAKAKDPLLGSGGSFTGGPGLTIQRARIRSLMTGQPFQITKEDVTAGENRASAQTASLQQRGNFAYLPDPTKLQMIKNAQEQAARGDRRALDALLPQMTSAEKQQAGLETDTGQELHAGQAATTGQPLQPPIPGQQAPVSAPPSQEAPTSPMHPEEQQEFADMAGQTGSALEIKTSDATARNRAAYSATILTEIKQQDLSPVMAYSGTGGAAAFRADQLSNAAGMLRGPRLKQFNDYQTFAKETHKFITDTLRQSMATSVREGYVAKYIADAVANMSQGVDNALNNNPALALQRWNKLVEYLDHYHDGAVARVKGGVAGQEKFEKGTVYKKGLVLPNVPNSTQENIDHTAKKYGVSSDEVIQRLKQKHGVG